MQEYSGRGDWSKVSIDRRCRIIASVAPLIAEEGERWTELCQSEQRVDPVETITGELFPLCAGAEIHRQRRAETAACSPAWLARASSLVMGRSQRNSA